MCLFNALCKDLVISRSYMGEDFHMNLLLLDAILIRIIKGT